MPRVQFTRHLARYFPALRDGDFDGATLAEVVAAIDRAHPGLGGYVLDDRGAVRKHVNVFIGDDLLRDRARLDEPLPPGVTVSIFQALSGG
ncbi:MAG: MoaD/ThiS family protein [Planctomycetota bacterium]|nr:MoaD/ThiS family protein [Planctomycetota bacterium]